MDTQAEAIGWARVSSPKQWNDGDHKVQENKIEVWCGDNTIRYLKATAAQYRKSENPFDNPEMRYLLYDIDTLVELDIQPDMVIQNPLTTPSLPVFMTKPLIIVVHPTFQWVSN
jgi:hypothetical protein